ncbi:hypothetical protein [Methylobacterium frigidaeris]|uniref:Uncharacterized protein n=1 Tax=Methylobacterium frigidaeris TaxID=2038277 RepID=A0AA37HHP5_9HYPH|nr:hypothetical protein [Methylobacterium frigidaeris]PIK70118.1 hypothetical protein CS379_26345 [Methylobacterium frigidaeris]GJD65355.1 hypothetical protein MPEAHAMD_5543 [Methylobacterium frigidaeris]
MKFGDGVPRWARRRVERHLARHSDGKVVRWMSFAMGNQRVRAEAGPTATTGNVLPFIRRAPVAEPGGGASVLDATGS